jgi:hypothetical protein
LISQPNIRKTFPGTSSNSNSNNNANREEESTTPYIPQERGKQFRVTAGGKGLRPQESSEEEEDDSSEEEQQQDYSKPGGKQLRAPGGKYLRQEA